MRCTMGRLGVIPLNCTDRWEGSVEYRRIHNGFPAFWLVVFSMAWHKCTYTIITVVRWNSNVHTTVFTAFWLAIFSTASYKWHRQTDIIRRLRTTQYNSIYTIKITYYQRGLLRIEYEYRLLILSRPLGLSVHRIGQTYQQPSHSFLQLKPELSEEKTLRLSGKK